MCIFLLLLLLLAFLTKISCYSVSNLPNTKHNAIYFRGLTKISCYSVSNLPNTKHNAIYFSGGGIFFWWQSGFGQYWNENCQNECNNIPLIGASAGSLTAALIACNVDFYDSLDFVLKQAERERLYDRKSLFLIWGKLIEEWLEYLLPDKLPLQAQENLYIALSPLNVLRVGSRVELVSNYHRFSCM